MTDQREDEQAMCGGNGECFRAWMELDAALIRAEAAESSLSALRRQMEQIKEYAQHREWCQSLWEPIGAPYPCTCGLAELLK